MVYDASANNPAVDGTANPNWDEAYPPLGLVKFKYFDGASTTVVATCPLMQSPLAGPPPLRQAMGQAPFVSTCVSTSPFSMSGPIATVGVSINQASITVEYETECTGPCGGGGAAPHGGSTYAINVDFKCLGNPACLP
jgi:hypothetical protein